MGWEIILQIPVQHSAHKVWGYTSQYTTKPTVRLVRICAVWSESSLITCAFYSLQAIQRGINENSCHTWWMYRSLCWSHNSFCWFCRALSCIIHNLKMTEIMLYRICSYFLIIHFIVDVRHFYPVHHWMIVWDIHKHCWNTSDVRHEIQKVLNVYNSQCNKMSLCQLWRTKCVSCNCEKRVLYNMWC